MLYDSLYHKLLRLPPEVLESATGGAVWERLPDGGTRVLRGEKVIISTGSRTTVETVPGLLEASPLTHIEC